MRTFVQTFRTHLQEAGAAADDDAVWHLLRRLQILAFDFTAPGSAAEALAKERAVRALHPEDASRAAALWTVLTTLSIKIAASGGDRTRDQLKEDLRQESFRLAGDAQNFRARATLAEASQNALADISDHIGGALLTRQERIAAVHAALDTGRYVEVRGDAGVGKSGVLKHVAQQVAGEAPVMVLGPHRTVPGGWLAMKAVLGFDGTARELLSEMAGSGSALLFVDNLDFFEEGERRTAIDLVRAAATVPGIALIATARREFGVTEPSWLPANLLDQIGRAEPVFIDELTTAEVDELRDAAPQLRALLAENHPARQVARNLFRLSRLASLPATAPVLRTEAEMAQQWWQTADGAKDHTHRDRARVLRALADQVLARDDQLNVSDFPAAAVDALVATETLRDLGNDRVSFRHDVLREWAIANLVFSEPALVQRLPLDRPAPTSLARGVELAARLHLEDTTDSAGWKALLDSVSNQGDHGSWRRASVLALVRSEIGTEVLMRTSGYLLANDAALLRELIRLVLAVDVEPGRQRFAAVGLDAHRIPASLHVPNGPSWTRLILWLLSLDNSVPGIALPEVVELYTTWALGLLGQDPLTPSLVPWLYRWLRVIEIWRDGSTAQGPPPFTGEPPSSQLGALEDDLRTGFLLFCNRAPGLAAEYLESLRNSEHGDDVHRGILKARGTLAQAAPKELADFTEALLISADQEEDEHSPWREAFGHLDLEFVPASPAQGPFLELLVHAPEQGLRLVRRLVDHEIMFHSGGRPFGTNAITIVSIDGSSKIFAWMQSYNWSRDVGSASAVVTSALMALEAWAHRRIDAGDLFDKVLADVLGGPDVPAAYLLVAVDLILSHWPAAHTAAIPFLACPELLCLDRERLVHDTMEFPDIFGLRALQKEPVGLVTVASLKARPSRRRMLEELLPYYALEDSGEQRTVLTGLLQRAAARVGPPREESTLRDPDFMVVRALNALDPHNWQKSVSQPSGAEQWDYVPPATETQHLQRLQAASHEQRVKHRMQSMIRAALNDPKQSSPTFAAAAIEWAQQQTPGPGDKDEDEQRLNEEAVVIAAMIAARDGDAGLLAKQEPWLHDTFSRALRGTADPVHRVRSGLQFNPTAIAFVGMILLLKQRWTSADVRIVLESASNENPAAAHGFAATAPLLVHIDARLPRAVLRCAFAASIKPQHMWGKPEAEQVAQAARYAQRISAAIDEELAWLANQRDEPAWPAFSRDPVRPRWQPGAKRTQHKTRAQVPEPDVYTDDQAAALWLKSAASLFDVAKHPWLRDIIATYGSWTSVANGAELEDNQETDQRPRDWNEAFFKLQAHCLPGLPPAQIADDVLAPVLRLPDEAFLDVTTTFLPEVDAVYFNDRTLEEAHAVQVRSALACKLMMLRVWERHVQRHATSTEIHLGPAVAVTLFNDYANRWPPKCYLLPAAMDRLEPFLPLLKQVVDIGSFLLVVIAFLNLVEVAPQPTHLPLIIAGAKGWLSVYRDDKEFWMQHQVAARLCAIIELILAAHPHLFRPGLMLRKDLDVFLGNLVSMGSAEAHQLEERLRSLRQIE